MTSKKGRNKPRPFNAKVNSKPDDLLTVCKKCVRGIFKGQERVWVKGAGLVHLGCLSDETTSQAS